MGKNSIGGNILLPYNEKLLVPELILQTLRMLGNEKDIMSISTSYNGRWQRLQPNVGDSLAVLLQVGYGSVMLPIAGMRGHVVFGANKQEEYYKIWLGINEGDIAPARDINQVNHFVVQWIHLCEELQALYAFMHHFSFETEEEYLKNVFLPALHDKNVTKLLDTAMNWLMYFGTDLALQAENRHVLEKCEEEEQSFYPQISCYPLDSGAWVVRTGNDPTD